MAEVIIENIIATANLHQEIDLEKIAQQLPKISFDPGENPAVVFHFDQEKSAVLLSEHGKIVCTGTTSMIDAERFIEKVVEQLQEFDQTIEHPEVSLHQIVATADLLQSISLDLLIDHFPKEKITYNPQINPWLQYEYDNHLSILFLATGKMVFTGKKDKSQLSTIYETVKDTLSSAGVI
jgi:transcription initiation factor TFIID TATA-box-binding protein